MLRDKKGTTTVEAAVVLPLVILTLISVIIIMINMYCEIHSNVRNHLAVSEETGKISGTVRTYKNRPEGISLREGTHLFRKCVYGTETFELKKGGLLDHSISRDMESRGYCIDEKKLARYVDFFDKGT